MGEMKAALELGAVSSEGLLRFHIGAATAAVEAGVGDKDIRNWDGKVQHVEAMYIYVKLEKYQGRWQARAGAETRQEVHNRDQHNTRG